MGSVIGRLKKGWALLMKTKSILAVRLGIYAAFAVGIAIYFLIFAGLAYLFGSLGWIVVLLALDLVGAVRFPGVEDLLCHLLARSLRHLTPLSRSGP